jgi:diphthine synthase
MLTFVGLGLYDERSITIEGKQALERADRAFGEFYTSRLAGVDHEDLEAYHDTEIEVLSREDVERQADRVLDAAADGETAFLTGGDPMMATTHVDLRLRAHERGIRTRIVHGTTARTAAASLTGLQNYRFGTATTLPFPDAHGGGQVPDSVLETVEANADRGLHTLVYLDIKVDAPRWEGSDSYLTGDRAAGLLADDLGDRLGVVLARAGSPNPGVAADELSDLARRDFGRPLHLLVLPGDLHEIEREALAAFADAPIQS